MIVGSLRVRLLVRESRSLKDKRQVVRSIKDRLRNTFHVSVAEVDAQDDRQLEVASETILFELRDPRVKMVTVTRAEVSGDLQHAKVYVSIMGTPKEQELTMHGLRHATGFLQSKLARRLQTRFTP